MIRTLGAMIGLTVAFAWGWPVLQMLGWALVGLERFVR